MHSEGHGHHSHDQHHEQVHEAGGSAGTVLTIRMHSGLSGDMCLAGLLAITGLPEEELDRRLTAVLPELTGSVRLVRRQVHHVAGWHAQVSLPRQHEHRTLADILKIIENSGLSSDAKALSGETFSLLARAEAAVHEKRPEEIHFHEVGALDSILDICLSCELHALLRPSRLVASALPLSDGSVSCAHGILPVPAPAVLELLDGIPVKPFPDEGETVTPTAIALLRSLGAEFGPWPAMRIRKKALVYGNRVFEKAPNGAVFAWGSLEETAF